MDSAIQQLINYKRITVKYELIKFTTISQDLKKYI